MHAEIIALGTELTNGSKLDTNSQWLSIELAALGIEVVRHSTIGDSMQDMVEALQAASKRVQFVIITGGLGPTLDDLTRQAMAEAAGVELVTDEPSLAHLKSLFESRGREMPSRNEIQAMFPAGAKPVLNPRGTAPGIDQTVTTETNTCRLVALPGVPSEMKPMFTETVGPSLAGSGLVIRRARINCFGAGESGIEEMLGDLTARGREPEVGITASEATITMRITASGKTVTDCETQLSTTRDLILK
ncbi:MAG: competence/damage-inducible protein A, partial [Planctomycetaceae bacterium]